jgi:hypothetical protein
MQAVFLLKKQVEDFDHLSETENRCQSGSGFPGACLLFSLNFHF